MRIKVIDFNGKDVRVSIEAENEAERYQLKAIKGQFDKAGAYWHEWDDMEGKRGIAIVAEKRPDVKLTGRTEAGKGKDHAVCAPVDVGVV